MRIQVLNIGTWVVFTDSAFAFITCKLKHISLSSSKNYVIHCHTTDIHQSTLDYSQFKSETILVLGGCGFLGARLVAAISQYNNNLHLSVRKTSNTHRIKAFIDRSNLYTGDLSDSNYFNSLVKKVKPTLIFYTVGFGSYSQQSDREQIFNNNVVCAHNLLMATSGVPHCRIIYAGTSLEQGHIKSPLKEQGIFKPISCYAAMKTAASIMMMQAAVYEKRPITVLNPFAIFGIGEPSKRLVPTIIKAALHGNELHLTQKGLVRDYIYVDDVVDAFLMAATNKASIAEKINIAGGRCLSNEQVVAIIEHLMNKKIKKITGRYEARVTDTNYWCADISKAKQILGWQPKHTIEQGLQSTIEWMLKNEQ